MIKLIINLSNSIIEHVTLSIINKLYDLISNNLLDSTSNLSGRIECDGSYLEYVNTIRQKFPNLYILCNKFYINFLDPVLKSLMINLYSLDNIGVSVLDVTGTSLSISFLNNTNIVSFNELNLLTNIKLINSNLFNGCSSLQSINLDNIETIKGSAFRECSNLTSIGSTNNIKIIESYGFYNTGLTGKISLPNLTTAPGQDSFGNSPITEFDISLSSITNLSTVRLFNNNSSLITIKLPNTVTSIGTNNNAVPFNACLNIKTITGVKGITNAPNLLCSDGLKLNCVIPLLNFTVSDSFPITKASWNNGNISGSSFKYQEVFIPLIYMPKFQLDTRTTIEKYYGGLYRVFFGNQVSNARCLFYSNLLYLRDIIEIKPFFFFATRFKNLVINKTTPPPLGASPLPASSFSDYANHEEYNTWVGTMFGDIPTSYMTIYVPDSAISAYQADSNYNSYTIKGISELTTYNTEEDWIESDSPENGLILEYM